MKTENINPLFTENGVIYLTKPDTSFEQLYLQVRKKEDRVLTDNEVFALPGVPTGSRYHDEWQLRAQSLQRLLTYVPKKNLNVILDLGCGNGWFAARLSEQANAVIYALDVNQIELEQAARVFSKTKVRFCYGDIFQDIFSEIKFDLVTINSAIQYFPSVKNLLERLMSLLSSSGEIHILDSPIYNYKEVTAAKARTLDYYTRLGFAQMASKYHHHTYSDFAPYRFEVLYQPHALGQKIKSRLGMKVNPFPWIKIQAQ